MKDFENSTDDNCEYSWSPQSKEYVDNYWIVCFVFRKLLQKERLWIFPVVITICILPW